MAFNMFKNDSEGLDRQAIMSQMQDQPPPPAAPIAELPGAMDSQMSGNTGINGGDVESFKLDTEPPAAAVDPSIAGAGIADAPAARNSTRLMEGDAFKLDPANQHQLKSPKYAFLQAANSGKYGYNDLAKMLGDLQADPNSGKFFKGWSANKDKLSFAGDRSQLDPAWNGVNSVDAIGAYGNMAQGKEPGGWRWGADSPESLAAAAGPGGGPDGDPSSSPYSQNSMIDTSGDFFTNLMKQLQSSSGAPNKLDAQAVKAMMGGQ